ncbi:MAG: YdiU family protein, partial [Deltaproteobacteria bacterium]|nr:YdiU family protein [Deltaproteobacteria bacterium]
MLPRAHPPGLCAALAGEAKVKLSPRPVLGAAWSPVHPTPVRAPRLLAWSEEVASQLGLSPEVMQSDALLAVLAGNADWPGGRPVATNYGGHQFGNWAGQLGDGRALLLGELQGPGGRFELQLKGAGPTPYSRR